MEATYLLMLYVTLDQEIAIRQLYTSSGWTFRKTESILNREAVEDDKRPSSTETESDDDVDEDVDDDDDDDDNLPYEIDCVKNTPKQTNYEDNLAYNNVNGTGVARYLDNEKHGDISQDLLGDVADSLSAFSNSFSDCEALLKEDPNKNGTSIVKTGKDDGYEQTCNDKLNLEVDRLLRDIDESDSKTNRTLDEEHVSLRSNDQLDSDNCAEKQAEFDKQMIADKENDESFIAQEYTIKNVTEKSEGNGIPGKRIREAVKSDINIKSVTRSDSIKTSEVGCNTPVSSFQLEVKVVPNRKKRRVKSKEACKNSSPENLDPEDTAIKDNGNKEQNSKALFTKVQGNSVPNKYAHSVQKQSEVVPENHNISKLSSSSEKDSTIKHKKRNNDDSSNEDTKEGKLKCSQCGLEFLHKRRYLKHLQRHEKNAFDCPDCGKKFTNIRNLNSHRFKRSGQTVFVCDICSFEATSACGLRSHRKKNHPPEDTFQCHLCAKIVKTKSYLNVHLKYSHNVDDANLECPICGRKAKRPKLFAKHMLQHEKDADFHDRKCPECGKFFRTKLHLRSHMRVHRDRTFLCDHCGKGFTTKTKLAAHNRTHTGDKPYHCSICDYKSTQKGNLTLHMKVHEKETEKLKKGEYVRGRKRLEHRTDIKGQEMKESDATVDKSNSAELTVQEYTASVKSPDKTESVVTEGTDHVSSVSSVENTADDEIKLIPDYYKYMCRYDNAIENIDATDSNMTATLFEGKQQQQQALQQPQQQQQQQQQQQTLPSSKLTNSFTINNLDKCRENFTAKLKASDINRVDIVNERVYGSIQPVNTSVQTVDETSHIGTHSVQSMHDSETSHIGTHSVQSMHGSETSHIGTHSVQSMHGSETSHIGTHSVQSMHGSETSHIGTHSVQSMHGSMLAYGTGTSSNHPSTTLTPGSESNATYMQYAEANNGSLYTQQTTYGVEQQAYGNQQDSIFVLSSISGAPNPNLLEQTASVYVDPQDQAYMTSDSTVHYAPVPEFSHIDQNLAYRPTSSFPNVPLPSDVTLAQLPFVNQSAADVNNVSSVDCQKVYQTAAKTSYADQSMYQTARKVEFSDPNEQHLYFASKFTPSVYPESPGQHLPFSDHNSQDYHDSQLEVYATLQEQHFPDLQQKDVQ